MQSRALVHNQNSGVSFNKPSMWFLCPLKLGDHRVMEWCHSKEDFSSLYTLRLYSQFRELEPGSSDLPSSQLPGAAGGGVVSLLHGSVGEPWKQAGDRELAKELSLPVAPSRRSNFPYSLSWTLWLPWQGHSTLYVMQKIFPSKVLCLQLWNWLVAFSPPRVSTGSCSCYFKTAAVKSVWERKVLCIMYRKKFQKYFSFFFEVKEWLTQEKKYDMFLFPIY